MDWTEEQKDDLEFLLPLLHNTFGGFPSMAHMETGKFVVLNECACSNCDEFRKTRVVTEEGTFLNAAKEYGKDMTQFELKNKKVH